MTTRLCALFLPLYDMQIQRNKEKLLKKTMRQHSVNYIQTNYKLHSVNAE